MNFSASSGTDLRRREQKGFTLIELTMAMFLGSIVLISASIMVVGSRKYIFNETGRVRMQQDLSLIETMLGKNIRQCVLGRQKIYANYRSYTRGRGARASGQCLKVVFGNNSWRVFYRDKSDFKVTDAKGTTALVQGKISNLRFEQSPKFVRTILALSGNGQTLSTTFISGFRNAKEGRHRDRDDDDHDDGKGDDDGHDDDHDDSKGDDDG